MIVHRHRDKKVVGVFVRFFVRRFSYFNIDVPFPFICAARTRRSKAFAIRGVPLLPAISIAASIDIGMSIDALLSTIVNSSAV
jgi:hypothetical protein